MIRKSFKLLRYNLSHIMMFEILYKLISLAILVPLIQGLLNLSVSAAGIRYLTAGTVRRYFASPTTFVYFFIILLLLVVHLLINSAGLIYALDCAYHDEKTNSVAIFFNGVYDAARVIRPRNFGIIFYVITIIPFTYTMLLSGSVVGIKIPQFLMWFYRMHKSMIAAVIAAYILLCFVMIRSVFTVHYYSLYNLDVKKARRKSGEITKKHRLKILIPILLINLCMTLVIVFFGGLATTIASGILKGIVSYKKFFFLRNMSVRVICFGLFIASSLLATPMSYAFLSVRFYDLSYGNLPADAPRESERERRAKHVLESKKQRVKHALVITATILAALLVNGYYIYLSVTHRFDLNIAYSSRATVTAHRGDSAHAPENTMAAIRLAHENQADIIEIDVRETADGAYVVIHDESPYRTTGVKGKIGRMTLEQVKRLDAGSYFSEEYAGERIPTLIEVLTYAKENDIFLNIELKPAQTDHNYVEGIVDLIHQFEFEDQCVLASMSYKSIKRVKELDPDITTAYIMTVAYGEIGSMEYADIFSLKHTYVSGQIVRDIRANDKSLWTWTVNRDLDVKNVLLFDVDSVITDDPYATKEVIYRANDTLINDWFQRLVESY